MAGNPGSDAAGLPSYGARGSGGQYFWDNTTWSSCNVLTHDTYLDNYYIFNI